MITFDGWCATVNLFLGAYLNKLLPDLPIPDYWLNCWFEHRVKAQMLAELLYTVKWGENWWKI